MEILINDILKQGGQRHRLQAKLFGGANVLSGLSNIGSKNSDFSEQFLRDEGIMLLGASLGGTHARKVQFWPRSGRARQALVKDATPSIAASELKANQRSPADSFGEVELF